MDPKAKTELVNLVKNRIGIVAAFFGEEGVRIIGKVVDEWLDTRAKKEKAARARARRKKS